MRHRFLTYMHNAVTLFVALSLLFFGWIFNSVTGWGIFYSIFFFAIFEILQIFPPLHALKGISKEQFVSYGQNEYLLLDFFAPINLFIPRFTVQLFDAKYFRGEGTLSSTNFKKKNSVRVFLYQLSRGYYSKLTVLMILNDYFQIWEKCRVYDQTIDLYVLPQEFHRAGKVLAYKVKKISRMPNNDAKISSFEFKGYRDYRNKDSLKWIDWKKTAKTRELIIRENYPKKESRNILLFWGEDNSQFENGLSIFYSMYRQLDLSIFEKIYLVGEKTFSGKQIDKKFFSLIDPFTTKIDLRELSRVRDRNIYFFYAVGATQIKTGTEFFKKRHNEVIQLRLDTMESLSIVSSYLHQKVNWIE